MNRMARRPHVGRMRYLVLVLMGLLVSGCKVSPTEYHSYTDAGGTTRCTAGQSYVGETGDQDAQGRVPAGASTEARSGAFCGDEDNLAPGWTYLDSQVFLYKVRADGGGFFTCDKSNSVGTTTARAVGATVQARCGAGQYFVRGLHGHVRTGSTLYRYESFTDLAEND